MPIFQIPPCISLTSRTNKLKKSIYRRKIFNLNLKSRETQKPLQLLTPSLVYFDSAPQLELKAVH